MYINQKTETKIKLVAEKVKRENEIKRIAMYKHKDQGISIPQSKRVCFLTIYLLTAWVNFIRIEENYKKREKNFS